MKTPYGLAIWLVMAAMASAQSVAPPAAAPTGKRSALISADSAAPLSPTELSLPAGTAIHMKLETPVSTISNKAGDLFSGRVSQPVILDGKTVVPVGTSVQGHVISVSEPRRIHGKPTIYLRPDSLTMPNGERYHLNASVIDTDRRSQTDVTEEGKIKGGGHDRGDTLEMAAGTTGGLALGALAGGAKGSVMGAGAGFTATVVHWLSKRKSVSLRPETELILELDRPVAMSCTGR